MSSNQSNPSTASSTNPKGHEVRASVTVNGEDNSSRQAEGSTPNNSLQSSEEVTTSVSSLRLATTDSETRRVDLSPFYNYESNLDVLMTKRDAKETEKMGFPRQD